MGKYMSEKPCILLVESDFAVRHPVAEYLRECGYRVLEATSSDEAVTLLNDETLAIDIVLSDVKNPGKLDAFELVQWIKDNDGKARVILTATPAKAAEKAGQLCEKGPASGGTPHHGGLLDRIKRLMATRDRRAGVNGLPAKQ